VSRSLSRSRPGSVQVECPGVRVLIGTRTWTPGQETPPDPPAGRTPAALHALVEPGGGPSTLESVEKPPRAGRAAAPFRGRSTPAPDAARVPPPTPIRPPGGRSVVRNRPPGGRTVERLPNDRTTFDPPSNRRRPTRTAADRTPTASDLTATAAQGIFFSGGSRNAFGSRANAFQSRFAYRARRDPRRRVSNSTRPRPCNFGRSIESDGDGRGTTLRSAVIAL
jgi:hypothetical protein